MHTHAASDRPLPLWRVLEEEHLALGLTLPKSYSTARDEVLKELGKALSSTPPGSDNSASDTLRSDADKKITGLLMTAFAAAPRRALCFSGGGIRSATFNLGVLQRLAMTKSDGTPVAGEDDVSILERVHFLSTVSGGGYVGGWFSAWARRSGGIRAVRKLLGAPRQPAAPAPSPVEPEAPPLVHLRRFSRYLSPRAGLLGADMWTIISTYLRNLLINWMVLIPALMAVLMAPRLAASVTALYFSNDDVNGAPAWLRWTLLAGAVLLGGWAFAYAGMHQPSARKSKQWLPWEAAQPRDFVLLCLLPVMLCAFLLSLYWAWQPASPGWSTCPVPEAVLFGAFGIAISVVGWLGFLWVNPGGDRVEKLLASIAGGAVAGLSLYGSFLLLKALADDQWRVTTVALYTTLAVPLILSSLSAGGMIFVALVSHPRIRSSSDEDREWWARFGAYVLLATVIWVGACGIGLILFELLAWALDEGVVLVAGLGGAAGIATAVLGYSQKTPRAGEEQATAGKGRSRILALAAPLFIITVLTLLSHANSYPIRWAQRVLEGDPIEWTRADELRERWVALGVAGAWMVVLGVWASGLSLLINLNKFTMHGLYRDRLIRAYLGASNPRRKADPFTGFDPNDNIFMHQMSPWALREEDLEDAGAFMDMVAAGDGAAGNLRNLIEHSRGGDRTMSRVRAQHAKRRQGAARQPYPRWIVQNTLTAINRLIFTGDLRHLEPAHGAAPLTTDATPQDNRHALERLFANALKKRKELRLCEQALAVQAAEDPDLGPPSGPLHIVNIALNLVRADDPAWQDRKAQSFTMSPLHCGSWNLGYRPSVSYGGAQGVSLGTALSTSGAAASPNMGYHSSAAVTFVLSFFNVRLGCWLGNPGPAGAETHTTNGPRFGLWPMLTEILGATSADRGYVYLSDGGHFENLGLYEMVRRRCREIIVCDAGCDEKCAFEDLGNAVRKVRADMGVDIEFSGRIKIQPRDPTLKNVAVSYAVGRIRYSRVDPGATEKNDGWLLYIKPSFYGDEPVDVYNYALRYQAFPHESTGDQFFSESQFESYRALGQHVVDQVAKFRQLPDKPDLGRQELLGTLI